MKQYIRKNILKLEPYATARDEFQGGDIDVWVDANESPYTNGVNRYPDPHQKQLKKRIASIFDISAESIFIGGAGSDEAIDIVFRIFCEPGIDNAVAITPSYGVYKVAAAINDIELREVFLNEDFSLPTERLMSATDKNTKVIWICSPNNPTGNAFPKEELIEIARRFNGIVVIDEAYVDFSDKGSMITELERLENVIVLRTFSKAWGMAGMRAGMAIANPDIIEYFDRVKYPYNMSSIIQNELLKRIDCGTGNHIPQIIEQRNKLLNKLKECGCIEKIYPSDANFILIKVTDANAVYDYLIDNGVIVRNRSSMPLCFNTLRVTIGTPEENDRIINLLSAYPVTK